MKIIPYANALHGTEREVKCPKGGFTSIRLLLKEDGMGFSLNRTTIHATKHWQKWHYKHHFEACYCISGHGKLKDSKGKVHEVKPGTLYALDKHDKHFFKTDETVVLICVFNPPLNGKEIHDAEGCYPLE